MKCYWMTLLLVASVACHSRQSLNREQKQYEVVQEGASSSATTTVGAPGEAATTTIDQTITGTNADTTTDFTIATNTAVGQQPGTLAGSLNGGAGVGRTSLPSPSYRGAHPAPSPSRRTDHSTNTGVEPSTSASPEKDLPVSQTTSPPETTTVSAPGPDLGKSSPDPDVPRQPAPPDQPPPTTTSGM